MQVPLKDGQTQDFSKLPIDKHTENLLLLCGIDGNVDVKYIEEKYSVRLSWKPEHFPTVLLWLSNRGEGYEKVTN